MSQKKIKKQVSSRKFHPQAVRHAKDVDLSKADPKCDRCGGSGMLDSVQPDESMRKGGVNEPVPVICRCVTRNGGVAPHPMIKMLSTIQTELKSGQWAKAQIRDLKVMSPTNKKRALAYFRAMLENENEDPNFVKEVRKVLNAIEPEGVN